LSTDDDLLGIWNLHQDAERQNVVDHGLADVENGHATLGQNTGNGCGKTRTVNTGDVNQDNFAQSAPPSWKKTAFYPLSVTIGHSQRFAGLGPVAILRVNFTDQEPSAVNRPTPVKTDNFFLLIFRALRHRRVPIALRIASHNVILVALALVIYACVMGLQFKQAMHEQADALGESLTTQTATSATELLVSNDILSLNVLLNNLTKNPLVAHAAIYSVDNRIIAEAGQRPRNGLLGETEGLYQSNITFQDVKAGQLRISLDMQQFQQPMTISLQSMGILSAILLALALALSLRLGRHITTPLMQLRVWLRDIPITPRPFERQDEIGDLARQLALAALPHRSEPEAKPEPEEDSTTATTTDDTSRPSKCAT
jgi:uncharacterized membrane protein affecting hemolysin expression